MTTRESDQVLWDTHYVGFLQVTVDDEEPTSVQSDGREPLIGLVADVVVLRTGTTFHLTRGKRSPWLVNSYDAKEGKLVVKTNVA